MTRVLSLVTLILALLAAQLAVEAQTLGKVYRVGMLERTSPETNAANLEGFRQGLRALGYMEGKQFVIEYRSAEGRDERFPSLAAGYGVGACHSGCMVDALQRPASWHLARLREVDRPNASSGGNRRRSDPSRNVSARSPRGWSGSRWPTPDPRVADLDVRRDDLASRDIFRREFK